MSSKSGPLLFISLPKVRRRCGTAERVFENWRTVVQKSSDSSLSDSFFGPSLFWLKHCNSPVRTLSFVSPSLREDEVLGPSRVVDAARTRLSLRTWTCLCRKIRSIDKRTLEQTLCSRALTAAASCTARHHFPERRILFYNLYDAACRTRV